MEDNGWISPPDSICSSLESGIASPEASFPGSFEDPVEGMEQNLQDSCSQVASGLCSAPFAENYFFTISPSALSGSKISMLYTGSLKSESNESNECVKAAVLSNGESVTIASDVLHPFSKSSEEKIGSRDEISSFDKVKIKDVDVEAPISNMHGSGRASRGKYKKIPIKSSKFL